MTPEQYERLRQPLIDELGRARAQYEQNVAPLRAELVRLQERFYTLYTRQPVFTATSGVADAINDTGRRWHLTDAELACAKVTIID